MLSRLLWPVLVFVLLLALWQGYCAFAKPSPLVLPAPWDILAALWRERAAIAPHARATLAVAALGFALSTGFAVLVSLALQAAPWAERALLPLFTVSQTVPLVALAPLMILWFGFGLLPKVLLVILVTFLPILLSLLAGYRQTPQAFRDLLAAMGAGRIAIFRRAVWPSARPNFFAGLRISATYGVVATIFAEYAGARQGLGIYILAAKNNFRADLVLAAVVVSAGLTLVLLGALRGLERVSARGPEGRRDA